MPNSIETIINTLNAYPEVAAPLFLKNEGAYEKANCYDNENRPKKIVVDMPNQCHTLVKFSMEIAPGARLVRSVQLKDCEVAVKNLQKERFLSRLMEIYEQTHSATPSFLTEITYDNMGRRFGLDEASIKEVVEIFASKQSGAPVGQEPKTPVEIALYPCEIDFLPITETMDGSLIASSRLGQSGDIIESYPAPETPRSKPPTPGLSTLRFLSAGNQRVAVEPKQPKPPQSDSNNASRFRR